MALLKKRGSKYLNIDFTDSNDEVLEFLSGIKSCIEKINNKKSGKRLYEN